MPNIGTGLKLPAAFLTIQSVLCAEFNWLDLDVLILALIHSRAMTAEVSSTKKSGTDKSFHIEVTGLEKPYHMKEVGTEVFQGEFNADVHLNFKEPSTIYTMEDLGLPSNTGVSPFAVSEPFSLFTEEAVHRMRAEILTDKVFENCKYSSNLSQCQLRGFASEYAVCLARRVEKII